MKIEIENKGIILFDGYCNLCSWSVQFILKRDHRDYFRFAALQSDFGSQILKQYKLPANFDQSVILIEDHLVYLKSDAALRITKNLRYLWPLLYIFKVVPKIIRDKIYMFISNNRFKWFGKKTSCYLPNQFEKNKFL